MISVVNGDKVKQAKGMTLIELMVALTVTSLSAMTIITFMSDTQNTEYQAIYINKANRLGQNSLSCIESASTESEVRACGSGDITLIQPCQATSVIQNAPKDAIMSITLTVPIEGVAGGELIYHTKKALVGC